MDRMELFHTAIPLPKALCAASTRGYPETVNRHTLFGLNTDDRVQAVAVGLSFERASRGLGTCD